MLQSIENNLLENVQRKSQVVIISANGPVFSSGHDLKELVLLNYCILLNSFCYDVVMFIFLDELSTASYYIMCYIFQTKETGSSYHKEIFDKCSEVMSLIQVIFTQLNPIHAKQSPFTNFMTQKMGNM